MAQLLTGAIGMASEGGEFAEIVKNVYFKVNHWMMQQSSMLNESWVILFGIGLMLAGHWIWTLMK